MKDKSTWVPSVESVNKVRKLGRTVRIQQELQRPLLSKDKRFIGLPGYYPMGDKDIELTPDEWKGSIDDTVLAFCKHHQIPLFAASWWPVYSKLGEDNFFTTSFIGLDEDSAKECKLIGFVIAETLNLGFYYDITGLEFSEIEEMEQDLLEAELYLIAGWRDKELYTVCLDDGKGNEIEEYVMRWEGDTIDAVIDDLISELEVA